MSTIEAKCQALSSRLDEAALRVWAAAEARSLGRGGVSTVAKAIGMSRTTIHAGLSELKAAAPALASMRRTICDLLSQIVLALTHESAHQIKATIVNVRAGVEPIRGAAPQLAGSQRWYALARYIVGKILAFVPNTPIPAAAATG